MDMDDNIDKIWLIMRYQMMLNILKMFSPETNHLFSTYLKQRIYKNPRELNGISQMFLKPQDSSFSHAWITVDVCFHYKVIYI